LKSISGSGGRGGAVAVKVAKLSSPPAKTRIFSRAFGGRGTLVVVVIVGGGVAMGGTVGGRGEVFVMIVFVVVVVVVVVVIACIVAADIVVEVAIVVVSIVVVVFVVEVLL